MKDKNIKLSAFLSCLAMTIILASAMAQENQSNIPTKFVQPDVEIRSINDIINKTTDGSVELYAQNPSSNQVNLQIDIVATTPSGINLYSDIFPLVGGTGIVNGSFQVMPGQTRTIYIRVKSNNIGNYSVQYNETYYPAGDKSGAKTIYLIGNYSVEEPSAPYNNPNIPVTPEATGTEITATGNNPNAPVTPEVTTTGTPITATGNNPSAPVTPEATKTSPFISTGILFTIVIIIFLYRKIKV